MHASYPLFWIYRLFLPLLLLEERPYQLSMQDTAHLNLPRASRQFRFLLNPFAGVSRLNFLTFRLLSQPFYSQSTRVQDTDANYDVALQSRPVDSQYDALIIP